MNEVDSVEPTDGSVDPSEVIGREVEASFLVQDLLGNSGSNYNQFKALGIVGTAGSGKTSICQKMFNSPQVQKHFLPRIWVCMTRSPGGDADPKVTVTKRMLTCLGEDEEIIEEKRKKDGISGLVSLLHRQLVGKRFLIVLDGACDADEWFNLGSDYSIQRKPDKGKNFTWLHSTDWSQSLAFGLPKGFGGAVIVNGRSDKVVEMMVGKENLHHLHPLTDEDCWAILKKATVYDPELDPQVVQLRRLVVQGAGGHPLLAKHMGQRYKQVKDPAQQAANNSSNNGSSTAPVTRPESTGVTASPPANRGNGSSTAPVTRPESTRVTASPPADRGNGTRPESTRVTAPPLANRGNGSSIAQVTGPESAQVTTPPPINSSNGSSVAQVTGPEASQITALQPVNSSKGSSMEDVIAPQVVDGRGVIENWSNRLKRLGSLRVKFPFGSGGSKPMGS